MKSLTAGRTAATAVLGLMFATLLWRLVVFLGLSLEALRWPFGLDYGEGIVWQQANMMFTPRAYGPIDGFPAIVFHYTPLYHVATRALAALAGLDMLFAGRLVSIVSTLAAAVVMAAVGARAAPPEATRAERMLAGAGGALSVFCFFPLVAWARLMRVDMLADFLSVLGFWLSLKAFQRPGFIYAAALCFVGSVFTKQTTIAAPAAIALLGLWLRPPLALRLIGACVAMGLAALAILEWETDGGFVRHILLYNINSVDLAGLRWIAFAFEYHAPLLLAALLLASLRTYEMRRRANGSSWRALAGEPADLAWLGLLFYFGTSTVMLGSIAKEGATFNYLIEWLMVISMLAGGGLAPATRFALNSAPGDRLDPRLAMAVVIAPLLIAIQGPRSPTPYVRIDQEPLLTSLVERLGRADKPIISDDMVLVLRSGKPVVWEPAIFKELGKSGVWNEQTLIERLKNRDIAMFITQGQSGGAILSTHYNPEVAKAVDEAYPVLETYGDYTLHLPRP